MKKAIGLLIVLTAVITSLVFLNNRKNEIVMIDGEKAPFSFMLKYDMGELIIEPWYQENTGVWYVFFPSHIKGNEINCSKLKQGELWLNGEKQKNKFEWQENKQNEIVYCDQAIQIIFLKDKNLSSLFIDTESGNNDLIRAVKENVESGHIVSIDAGGNIQYDGKMKEISGHGNAWEFYEKRAYDIKLPGKATLAGIDGGNQWKLLHLWNDGDKIHSKLAFDIAEILKADYTPDSIWVNVYLNGEYHGMYLLTTAVRGQAVFNTQDALFLEKDLTDRYVLENHVISDAGNGFVIHRPKEVTEEEKAEIRDMVQMVEDSINAGKIRSNLIDVDSFVTQFLVDEIALNSDGFETSSYFYKVSKEMPLCAGPAWDYDGAFGEYLHMGDNNVNPGQSVLDGEVTELTWYQKLYDNQEFIALVKDKYKSVMPQLQQLYEETIDVYAEYIESAVRNDDIRWSGYNETLPRTGNYQSWENDIRYLKYFCMTRYNELMKRWEIEDEKLVFPATGEMHEVKVLCGGVESVISVPDGEPLKKEQLEAIGWDDNRIAEVAYSEEKYSEYMPVLEDFAIKIKSEIMLSEDGDCKYIDIPQDIFAEDYEYVSVMNIASDGTIETLQLLEPMKDIHLQLEKEKTGTIAIYVFEDESGTRVLEEVIKEY